MRRRSFLRFPHADDAAAADAHAGALNGADGIQAVLESVGGDDVPVMLRRRCRYCGCKPVDAGFLELVGLHSESCPRRHADLHAQLAHFADSLEHDLNFWSPSALPFQAAPIQKRVEGHSPWRSGA